MKAIRYFLLLFALFLPLNTKISNGFLILTLIASLYYFFRTRSFSKARFVLQKLLVSTLAFFILHLMGLLFTDYLGDGFRYLEKTVSFLLVPFLFLFYDRSQLDDLKTFFQKGLLIGSVLSILILLGLNFHNYFSNQEGFRIGQDLFDYYHTYHHFVAPLGIHPTYLGVFYLTVLIFMGKTIDSNRIRLTLTVLFILGLLFLNSRIVFFGTILVMVYYSSIMTREMVRRKKYATLFSAVLIMTATVFLSIKVISGTYIASRIQNALEFEFSTNAVENFNNQKEVNPRMARWVSGWKLVKERPFFGYGIADEYPNLETQFREDGLYSAANAHYNAHNQYLGYAIRFGGIGLLVLLYFLITNMVLALKQGHSDYFLLLLVIACVNVMENYFDRNFGITFSAVIFTLYSYSAICDSNKIEKRPGS